MTATGGSAFNCTDLGNAERLVARHGHELRWCDAQGWMAWDGRCWASSEEGARRLAVETVRSIYEEALSAGDDADRRRLATWAARSEGSNRISAMLELTRWLDPVHVRMNQLDSDRWLLNVGNGTVELRTGELREHRPGDLITKLAPVDYDPGSRSDLWERFLAQATAGQDGLADFLRRAAGYTLSGVTEEDKLFVPHGPAGAGKTTFTGTLRAALGGYADSVRIEALTERGSGGHNEDVAVLAGQRMVLAVEASESDRLREGLVKTLTGGDQIPASRKHRPVFFFEPQFKLWLATNFVPRIRSEDSGMWRRLLKLPFLNVPTKPDRTLRLKLRRPEHLRAVLAWAVRGCLEWQRDGLRPPACVLVATEALRRSMDGLAQFLDDCCDFSKPDAWTTSKAIRDGYARWADGQAIPDRYRVSPNRLTEALRQRGCDDAARGRAGQRGWWGIRVFAADTADSADTTFDFSPREDEMSGKPADGVSADSAVSTGTGEADDERSPSASVAPAKPNSPNGRRPPRTARGERVDDAGHPAWRLVDPDDQPCGLFAGEAEMLAYAHLRGWRVA